MLQQNFELEFDHIAYQAWQNQKSPLERMYDSWVGEGQWEPAPIPTTFRIYDRDSGLPIPCHICDATDKWVVEGDEVRQIARVFVCEHEPVLAVRAGIRQISSVPVGRVGAFEETSRPLE